MRLWGTGTNASHSTAGQRGVVDIVDPSERARRHHRGTSSRQGNNNELRPHIEAHEPDPERPLLPGMSAPLSRLRLVVKYEREQRKRCHKSEKQGPLRVVRNARLASIQIRETSNENKQEYLKLNREAFDAGGAQQCCTARTINA